MKVLLVDDHVVMREALEALLEKEAYISVIGGAGNGREALAMVQDLSPDVVVMDVSMPELNGIEAARRISVMENAPGIIALSMHSRRSCVSEALRAGARGYVLKEAAADELRAAIEAVSSGKTYLSPGIADVAVDALVSNDPTSRSPAYTLLTAREREILQLLAEGKTTKEIARHLKVSVSTVETHRSNTMAKLKLHSVAELTRFAVREGLVPLDP